MHKLLRIELKNDQKSSCITFNQWNFKLINEFHLIYKVEFKECLSLHLYCFSWSVKNCI